MAYLELTGKRVGFAFCKNKFLDEMAMVKKK